MDPKTLSTLHDVFKEVQKQPSWKAALDKLFGSLRGDFVFDNVAIYFLEPQTKVTDVIYARALGRGKGGEADISWGETFALDVMTKGKMILREPPKKTRVFDRLSQAYLLGFPISLSPQKKGAIVFVRFGGPPYSELHIHLASLQSSWALALIAQKELTHAYEELDSVQRQMRLQDDFVSTISHELRTPLGFIKGYSTSLLRQDTSWDEATQQEFLTIIDEEADRLTRLIEDMLESARLQSKTLQFKFAPVRLDALVRDVALRVNTHHPDLKIDFDVEPLPPVSGDGVRLAQVFENLFSNAIKYAPKSPLKIKIQAAGKKARIAFSDQGEGIPEDYLPFLFERFYRVPGERTVTGTGLGLYICKQIVMAHHGNIWVESVLDQGTTFFIELPADPAL
ncbi:MAG: GAF domain-containing sensor histidine kinase [Anaerolineales bacterium]|nr:GAF domain-containing sensor histidine kinase [Anaerolineales bacterium]